MTEIYREGELGPSASALLDQIGAEREARWRELHPEMYGPDGAALPGVWRHWTSVRAEERALARTAELNRPEDPFPVPEVTKRLARRSEVGVSPMKVATAAQASGWRVLATYSRGYVPHRRTGAPGQRPVDCLVVKFAHQDGRSALGIWHDGSWESGWLVTPALDKVDRLGQLQVFLGLVEEGEAP